MEIWRFFDFQDGCRRHLGFLMRVLGPPTKVIGGLCHCAKFGWNRYSNFDNMQVLHFATQDWKRLSRPKIGVLGIWPPKWGVIATPKGTSLRGTSQVTYRSSKSVRHVRTRRDPKKKVKRTRMWANAERDGRPGKYRWRPLFNAAKFGWLTTRVPCSNAAKTRNPLKFAAVPQTGKPISAASGPTFTILSGHVDEVLLFNKFFPIVDTCLSCEDTARQSCAMVPN